MVLLSAPVNPGQAKDAYEALEIAYGGGEFSRDEAVSMLQSALSVSYKQADSILESLITNRCIS